MSNEVESEKIGVSEVLSIDDAKRLKGVTGEKAKELENEITSKQDQLFKDIYCVTFGWKIQEDKSRKLVSKMPNGKILFPDRTEDMKEIEPSTPYICLVYEREREAFAKVICEEYQPKIFIPSSRIPHMVWRDEKGVIRRKAPFGNTFEERIVAAIKEMEALKFSSIKVVFRTNQK
jgi:hypothetical protein